MKDNLPVCHHCSENSVRRHGLARSGVPRYYCTACKRTFQVRYIYQGNEMKILQRIKKLLAEGKSRIHISLLLGVSLRSVERHLSTGSGNKGFMCKG